jgi:CheY-like chemotaxis protein
VSSILGRGTVFKVEMPLGLVQEAWTPPEESIVEEFRPLNLRLLLAEDNYINQRMMLHALEKYGCQVQVAQNGREALELAQKHKYDAILMDCQMPEMDGYRATTEIRRAERERRTPIIALTAHALPGDREKCIASGMDDFLPKPVEFEQLVRTLQQWTGRELPLR